MRGWLLCAGLLFLGGARVQAQEAFIELAKGAVRKVIRAIDLKVQRLQNKTIWLQNVQKELENILAKTKLDEISDWVDRQRALYDDYFQELWKVKNSISTFQRVRNIVRMQADLVSEYRQAIRLFRNDEHFSRDEINYMEEVYAGIFAGSLDNLEQLEMVISAFSVQMSDGERLTIIEKVEVELAENYNNLRAFNQENSMMSLQRARSVEEAKVIRKMYGL